MAIEYKKLIAHIERISPPNLAQDWDNDGVQIYSGMVEIRRVLICLDITDAVINEAVTMNADMIIAHHPLIFHKLNKVDYKSVTGRYVTDLIRAGISVYSAHTSFDSVFGGNCDYLAELLGLQKIRRIQPGRKHSDERPSDKGLSLDNETSGKELSNDEIIGKIGDLKHETRFEDVCSLVKERLKIGHSLAVVGEPDRMIKKIGLCTGGGGNMIEYAFRNECSLFITSDIRHHEAMFAKENGICVIDAGHYNTEIIFMGNFAGKLKAVAGDLVEIYESTRGEEPFSYV